MMAKPNPGTVGKGKNCVAMTMAEAAARLKKAGTIRVSA